MTTDTKPEAYASGDRKVALFARVWWRVAPCGLAGILFGLLTLFATTIRILPVLLLFAAYVPVDGVFGIASTVMAARRGRKQMGPAAA